MRPAPTLSRQSGALPATIGAALVVAIGALSADVLPLFDTSVGVEVVDVPATWTAPGAFPAGTTTNDNNTTASITVDESVRPLAAYVNATAGVCTECTASRLNVDDDVFVRIDSSGTITHRAQYEVLTAMTPVPYRDVDAPVKVTYRGKASSSISHTLSIKNVTSGSFEALASGTFQGESELSGTVAKGSHYKDAYGRVTVRVAGGSVALSYNLQGDLLDVRQQTRGATAGWKDAVRIHVAGDEAAGPVLAARHVGFTNAARLTSAAVYADDGTRLMLYGNSTIESEDSATTTLPVGAHEAIEVRAKAQTGSAASWTFDLVARSPSGAWSVTHRVTWNLGATT